MRDRCGSVRIGSGVLWVSALVLALTWGACGSPGTEDPAQPSSADVLSGVPAGEDVSPAAADAAGVHSGALRDAAMRRGPASLPGAAVVGRFEGEIDPFGGESTLRFIPTEPKSAALPGVGRSPRTGTQLLLEQNLDELGYTVAECGPGYWDAKWAEEGSAWRFWLDEGAPRTAFFQRLVNGPPDSDGEDALRFCTEFTLRNISSNTYGDLWLMFDGIALERGYAFVDSVPRRLEGLGPDGTDLEYAPVSDRGMFNYGRLAPSEEVSRQWYFYRAPGSALQRFRVSGDVVEILHEECGNGQDNNQDGIPDSGCGLVSAESNCYLDADCLSGACDGSILDPDSVDAWVFGECEPSGLGQACLEDADCAGEWVCEGADPEEWEPGVCGEGAPSVTLGASCVDDGDCASGEWCPTSTSEERCSPRPVYDLGGDPIVLEFQWVPGGTFTMGSPGPGDPTPEVGRATNEAQVEVTLTRDYFVQRTPVTQGQWASVMGAWNALDPAERTMSGWAGATPLFGTEPSYFALPEAAIGQLNCDDADCPVERMNWWDAVVFANALSALEGLQECYTLTGCGAGGA